MAAEQEDTMPSDQPAGEEFGDEFVLERAVGICHFVTESNPGFSGILKHRYLSLVRRLWLNTDGFGAG